MNWVLIRPYLVYNLDEAIYVNFSFLFWKMMIFTVYVPHAFQKTDMHNTNNNSSLSLRLSYKSDNALGVCR